jgi:hypothetical protein
MKTVIGIFHSMAQMRKAIEELSAEGFNAEMLNSITNPEGYTEHPDAESLDFTFEDKSATLTPGARLTGLGPVPTHRLHADDLDAAAGRAEVDPGMETIPGGIRGALADWGFSEDEIEQCLDHVDRGRALLAVEIVDEVEAGNRVEVILLRAGAEHVLSHRDHAAV